MSNNPTNKLKDTKANKQVMIFLLSIIICWITMAFIIEPVKSDDYSGILINVLLGPIVFAVGSVVSLFLLGTFFVLGYFIITIIIILIFLWIKPSLEIYLFDNKFLSFIDNLFVKNLIETILDFEKSGIGIMFIRIILPWVFYFFLYLIAPPMIAVLNDISA